MARTIITAKRLSDYNKFSDNALISAMTEAIDASDGAEITADGHDERMLILIENTDSSEKSVTVKAAEGFGNADLTKSIAASSFALVTLESARFKNTSGEAKGKILITGDSGDIKIAVFMLP